MEYIVETSNLVKQFKKHKAVNDVSMHIPNGSIYGFVGRNGAGKTTLMKIIAGLSYKTSGDIKIFGKAIEDTSEEHKKIGCIIEAPGLYPNMTARQNIEIKAIAEGMLRETDVDKILQEVGLAKTGKKKAKNFSLGMRQRLGIAMALVGNPELLILDEPINGLDPQGIQEVRNTIISLNKDRGITIFISSHILDELNKVATHYGIIHNGVLIKEISSDELHKECTRSVSIHVNDIETSINTLKSIGFENITVDHNILRVPGITDNTADINEVLVKAGVKVSQLYISEENLENYFIELTGSTNNTYGIVKKIESEGIVNG